MARERDGKTERVVEMRPGEDIKKNVREQFGQQVK